ncbi:hypothetical protein Pa4123_24750 [Phytohabitans aurantiacus]|uniref:Uncharacterized protein n=1 Tax=Phytohabitans aurantiacus TaxID=3016789 RepID=A0ABQ5QV24_9ACTN|nr:hypothetical protein Pa4123_24750 [Phytohabitans aurantiacus]
MGMPARLADLLIVDSACAVGNGALMADMWPNPATGASARAIRRGRKRSGPLWPLKTSNTFHAPIDFDGLAYGGA